MTTTAPILVPVHYDYASSLCYVAHRVMQRLAGRFEGVEFRWTPIDLAALLNWNRGGLVPDDRRANVERVAGELRVPVRMPPTWLDSRRAMAVALALESRDAQTAWHERVYTAIFEEGRDCGAPGELEAWCRDLGLRLVEADLEGGLDELERRTREAADAMVTGVPTFMLAEWPMGGIQDDDTMVSLIGRFARRARERGCA